MKILNEKVLVRFVPCTVHSTSAMTLAVQTRTTQSSPEQLSWRRWQTGDLHHVTHAPLPPMLAPGEHEACLCMRKQ